MYRLYSSSDFGTTYLPDSEADTLESLKPRMELLDGAFVRWYIEKDGEELIGITCAVWRGHMHYVGLDCRTSNRGRKWK
jgi:hypothetical protein